MNSKFIVIDDRQYLSLLPQVLYGTQFLINQKILFSSANNSLLTKLILIKFTTPISSNYNIPIYYEHWCQIKIDIEYYYDFVL